MSSRKVFVRFLVGVLLVQAAWIAAMPAFRGPDEFDHVFRAEGVSHGSLLPGESIDQNDARGGMTPVRKSVVDAASRVCWSYYYTRYYDCYPYKADGNGIVRIGSGASRYNPTYYVIVGNVSRFFDGVAVDYAIRVVTALMCALLLAWAAALWVRRESSRWRTLGFVIALTPVMLFSSTIAAPNGVSYAAAVLLWVGGLTIIRDLDQVPPGAVAATTVGAVVMCNTHTTGPLWLLLIAVTWFILNPKGVLSVLRERRYWPMVLVIGAGAAASVAWTILSGANLPQPTGRFSSSPEIGPLASNEILWLLQTIAAFPLRNEMALPAVYILWLLGFGMLLVRALRSRERDRLAVVWVILGILATQTILTYVGFKTDGYAWQGRYGLPFTCALALLPVYLNHEREQPFRPLYHCALGAAFIATGLSVWHVAYLERLFFQRPWTDYLAGGPVIAGVLAAVGTAVMASALSRTPVASKETLS